MRYIVQGKALFLTNEERQTVASKPRIELA
jgi:hypothetical protein